MLKNKTIGVIQLGENKQVLETLLSFKGYTKSYPEIHKTIILRTSSASLEFLINQEFQKVIYLEPIDPSSIEKNIELLKEKIFPLSFSVLINLSFTKSSAYLSSIITAEFKLGFKYSPSNNLVIEDLWSKYIYGVVMGKNPNPFSIVDIYKSINGNKKGLQVPIRKKSNKLFFNPSLKNLKETLFNICKNFPEMEVYLINEHRLESSVLEDPLLMELQPKIKNLCGILSLEEFFKITLEGGIYLGGHSTFSLICSYNEIQSFVLYSEEEDLHLHMPYGLGNISLQEDISTKFLIKLLQNKYEIPVFETKVGNGYLLYNSISKDQTVEIEELFFQFYKFAFVICFEDIEEKITFPFISEKAITDLDFYRNGTNTLKELIEFGKKYSLYIIQELSNETPDLLKLKEYGDRMDEIDFLSTRLKKTFPLLGPPIEFFSHSKGLNSGENILDITQHIFLIYEEYSTFLDVILELINNIKSRFTIIEKGN